MILDVPPPKPSRRLTAFFACFALLPAVIIAAVWYISLQSDTTQLIRQSRAAQTSLTKILLLIEDAETGQRGFLLTGDQSYLVPFDSALPQIDRELEALGTDLADDPEGQQSVLTLRTVVEQKRDELRRTIELARAGDSAGALAIVREGSGKAYMGRIRDVVARLMADEQQRLTERIQTADGERRLLQELIVCAAVAAMALAVLAIFGARRYARDSAAAYRLISSANEELRREVIERERLGEQLRQSQKMEIIGQLTGGIAHDFNNMLAVINGNLTLISRRLARGETDVGKFVDGAFGAAERAAVLTHRLLAFSRQQPL
ncbi:MAG TPA: CHASE3 domain-containing protein, partial [Stellaceae bacterium]|nr:CHASE3 domain-containing protein [Stellaceae bacterium]